MMNPGTMFPKGYHSILQTKYLPGDPINGRPRLENAPFTSRSLSNLKYYFIDFGSAKQYPVGPDAPPPLEFGVQGHYDAPELHSDKYYNPMPFDVFSLGEMFLEVIQVNPLLLDRKPSRLIAIQRY